MRQIERRHWERLAASVTVDPEALVARVRQIALEAPDRLREVIKDAETRGLRHPVLRRLQDAVAEQARNCLVSLDRSRAHGTP